MNNNFMIKKDDFIEIIRDVKTGNNYYEEKNKLYQKNGVDGYLIEPECCATVIKLLHLIFGEKDKDNEIAQFCFTGSFGRKKKECLFIDDNDVKHEITDAGDLYDYLVAKGA